MFELTLAKQEKISYIGGEVRSMKKVLILMIAVTLVSCSTIEATPIQMEIPKPIEVPEVTTKETITVDIEKLKESCFMLYAENQVEISQGSAVYVDYDKVLTAYHVIDGYDKSFSDDATFETIGYVKSIDIALLKSPVEVDPVKIGDSDELEKGDKLIIIASPQGKEDTVAYTEVLALQSGFIMAKATTGGGASGGAVFDAKGNLVGILVGTRGSTESVEEIQNIVPINQIREKFFGAF
jgi:S1-C subfamily serine protease